MGKLIADGLPLHWGGMADPGCPIERRHRTGLAVLYMLQKHGRPCLFSTKGDVWLDRPWRDHVESNPLLAVQVSMVIMEEGKAAIVERGVPSPQRRMDVIKLFADLGRIAILRLRPYIIGLTDHSLDELISAAAGAGAQAVSVEWLCVDGRAKWMRRDFDKLSEITGYDVCEFYRSHSEQMGYYRLTRELKRPSFERLKALCEKHGLRLHVSCNHFAEEGATGCCCGLPDEGPFGGWSRAQFCNAAIKMKQGQELTLSEFAPDDCWLAGVKAWDVRNFGASETRGIAHKHLTALDWLRRQWNRTDSADQTPANFWGRGMAKVVGRRGRDLVYGWDGEQ
jgi:DNA repair photolyase